MFKRALAQSGVALLLCMLLAACSQSAPPATTTLRQQQTVEGLTIMLEMAAQPELNRPQHLVVTLADAQGQFVDDAEVYLKLEMTEHPMGTNQPIATAQGAGTYDVEAVYTMTGPWTIDVVAERGDKIYRATFTTTIEE